MSFFSRNVAIVVLGREPPFRKIEHTSHVGPPSHHRERAATEVRFQDGSRNGSKPSLVQSPSMAIRFGYIDRGYRSAIAHKVKNSLRILGIGIYEGIEPARAKPVFVHAES